MIDAELDRPAQDGTGGIGVAWRPEHARPRELHRAEADAPHREGSEVAHARQLTARLVLRP